MSNMIYILASLAWQPISFDRWQDDENNTWKLTNTDSPKNVIIQSINTYNKQQALQASKHRNGKGMENDVDWRATFACMQSSKSREDYAYKCALEAIISGSTWSNDRVHEIDQSHSALCPRCGVIDSDLHTYWLCPANQQFDSQQFRAPTGWLKLLV